MLEFDGVLGRRPARGFDTSYSVQVHITESRDDEPVVDVHATMRHAGFGGRVLPGVGRYQLIRRVK